MVESAFAAWDEVWADIGGTEFEDVGALAISLGPDDFADRTLASFRRLGLPHEVLDRSGVERLCPQLTLPADAWGVTAGPAGPLFANRIVTALVRWLGENGAELRPGAAVAEIDAARATAVLADGTRVAGDHLVVAAGAWLPTSCRGVTPTVRSTGRPSSMSGRPTASWRRGGAPRPSRPSATAASIRCRTCAGPGWSSAGAGTGSAEPRTRSAMGPTSTGRAGPSSAPSEPFLRDADDYVPERMQVGFYVMDETRRFRLDALEVRARRDELRRADVQVRPGHREPDRGGVRGCEHA